MSNPMPAQYVYCRQSILFAYRPPTDTRGSRWAVSTSCKAPIPKSLQRQPPDNGARRECYLLRWGLAVATALDWQGSWVLAHIGPGKYALTQCGDGTPRGDT